MKYVISLKLIKEQYVALCVTTEYASKIVTPRRDEIMRLMNWRPSEVDANFRLCREKGEVIV